MKMTSSFGKCLSLAFPRFKFSPDASPLPFFSLDFMLSPFDEATGGTGDWDWCMAVSFFPLIASSSFLPLFLPSYLFALLWCGLFGGPQSPRRWHEVPCSRKVSPALCPIMSPSMCYFSRLLLCIPSTSSCVPCPQWLLLFLNYVWVVAVLVCGGLFLSIAELGPQG